MVLRDFLCNSSNPAHLSTSDCQKGNKETRGDYSLTKIEATVTTTSAA